MEYRCIRCGEEFTREDLKELREMGERYQKTGKKGCILCPDCLDDFNHEDLEDQPDELLSIGGAGWMRCCPFHTGRERPSACSTC